MQTQAESLRKTNTEAWNSSRADVIWVLVVQKLLRASKEGKALVVHGMGVTTMGTVEGMVSALELALIPTRLVDLGVWVLHGNDMTFRN